MQILCHNLDLRRHVPALDCSNHLQPPCPGCVCSAGDEGHRHAAGSQRETRQGGCKGRAAQAAVLTCSSAGACLGPLALLPGTTLLPERSWPRSSDLSKPGPPRERCWCRDAVCARACAQGCVRVCKAGDRAQRCHSLARGKEFLPRAAYHLGKLCFPADPPAWRSMSYRELCYKQPGTPADRRLPRGSANAQAPPSPRLCSKQDPARLPMGMAPGSSSGLCSARAWPQRPPLPPGASGCFARAASPRLTWPLLPAPALRPWTRDSPSPLRAGCLCYSRARGEALPAPRFGHPSEAAEVLGSENPFFSDKLQIQRHRTRDLWTQQYLCTPAKLHKQG